MLSDRSQGRVLAVAVAVVLASLLAPGVLAQPAGQTEQEPNDSPLNATLVQPGVPVNGEINRSQNASGADADWYALPVAAGQNVTVTFESGNDSERLLVFLASPNTTENASAMNDTNSTNSTNSPSSPSSTDNLADAEIAAGGSTVTLNASANESQVFFVGVTGLSGSYTFTVETSAAMGTGMNGTNGTGMNGTDMSNMSNTTANGTMGTGMTSTPSTSTGMASTQTTSTPTSTSTQTSAASTGGENNGNGNNGNGNNGQGTSASGPGFGLVAALVALLAATLLAVRRR